MPRPGVERLEDLEVRQLRQVLLCGVVEAEPVLFDKLHHGQRRNRFGHRRDAKNSVDFHQPAAGDICDPEGSLIHDAAAIRDHRNHARHISAGDRSSQHFVDSRRCG